MEAVSARFKERLDELLSAQGVKQIDLVRHLGVTKTTVSRYANGRIPDAETLDRIARFFRVSVDYLLGRTDDPMEAEAPHQDEEFFYFLRGQGLTDEDKVAIRDLLEARRLRRERERGQQGGV